MSTPPPDEKGFVAPPIVQRLLLALLPTVLILSVAVSTVWGDNGLKRRHELRRELRHKTTELATIERENQRMLRQLDLMAEDPIVLERMVVEELGWARPGTVVYTFEQDR